MPRLHARARARSRPHEYRPIRRNSLGLRVNKRPYLRSNHARYRLCWCASGFPCISPSQHRVDVGSILIMGPILQNLQHRTCVSGQTCFIKGLLLESASDSNSITVLDTCGLSSAFIEGWPYGAGASSVTTSGTAAYWAEVVHAPGGQYRLCWCSSHCESLDSFADLGSLLLIGPAPLTYAQTCISGRQCAFDGLEGEGLQVGDAVQILSTCGTNSVPEGVPLAGRTISVATGTVSWGSVPITGPGGRYKLCWCSGDLPCGPEQFRLEIGTLDVLGPQPLSQHRTCISGATCFSPELTGYSMGGDTYVALLSSCGAAARSVNDEVGTARWSRGMVSVPGGQYRLCWCMPDLVNQSFDQNATDCTRWVHFQTDVGSLKVIGPAPWDQRQTCISGQSCKLGIQGEGSLLSARVLLLDTCGVGATFPGGHFLPGAILSQRLQMPEQNATDIAMYNAEEILAAGGTYRLCWCAGVSLDVQNASEGCLEASQFQTDFGSIDVVGPAPLQQDRTCVSGLTCNIEGIKGTYLNDDRLPDISGIRIKQDGAGLFDITKASVQVSHHTSVGPFVDVTTFELQTGTREWQIVFFNETNAPFFRLLVLETSSGWQPKPRELQWFSQEVWVTDMPSGWLAGGSGIPWKTAGPSPRSHGPEQLIDQDAELLTSRWEAIGFPRWYGMWYVTFDFSSGDRALILDTCGQTRVTARLPDAGMVQSVSHSGATIIWNGAPLSAAGGEYKLCWCAAYQDCDTADQFRIPIGTLTLVGPALDHSRTCVSGQTCTLEGLMGSHMSSRNMIAVLDTCAQVDVLRGDSTKPTIVAPFAALSASGGMVEFGTITGAGEYRLCWCPMLKGLDNISETANNSNLNQSTLIDCFHVDMGSLLVIGPILGKGRTCISGRACVMDGFPGHWLHETDRVFAMDTCGQLPLVSAGFDSLDAAFLSAGVLKWAEPITAAGGEYRLCWCSLAFYGNSSNSNGTACDASSPEAFLTDVGSLQVIGPSFSQSWTCVAGHSCRISGITGRGLSDLDSIMVLQTCATPALVQHFPFAGQADRLVGGGSEAAWTVAITAAAGSYRLCWCGAPAPNSTFVCEAWDYAVDLGSLDILGPAPLKQAATCISGQSCRVDGLTGIDWTRSGDRVAVLDTCGLPLAVPRWGNEGIAVEFAGVDSGAWISWDHTSISAAGGSYRLCWCGGALSEPNRTVHLPNWTNPNWTYPTTYYLEQNESNTTGSLPCDKIENFRIDFGELSLLGPTVLDSFYTCVAGQSCRIDSIYGTGMSLIDSYLVLDTCSSTGSLVKDFVPRENSTALALTAARGNPEVVSVTFTAVEALGGQYRLCWCPAYLGCSTLDDFRVDVAKLEVIGPSPHSQDRTCVSGQTCLLDGITGWYLSEQDQVMVLETCGAKLLPTTNLESWKVSHSGSVLRLSSSNHSNEWRIFLNAQAGQYRLCWCSGSTSAGSKGNPCDGRLPSLDFGSLSVLAPNTGLSQTCTSGILCVLENLGSAGGGGIFLADTCGIAAATRHFLPELRTPNASSAISSFITTLRGGAYRLCWCAPSLNGTYASCMVPEDFRVDVGLLQLLGPTLQPRTCVSGHRCLLDGSGGSVLVLDTCGFPTTLPIEVSNASLGVELLLNSAPAGQYRLCWCAEGAPCISEHEFLTDFGDLTLLGPLPLVQHRTCVSGHPCELKSFQGLGMDQAYFMVLETCSGHVAAGFPAHPRLLSSESWAGAITPQGGAYRLCWCMEDLDMANANATCQVSTQFSLQFGQLTILGPVPLQQSITCVSGTSCSLASFQHTADSAWLLVLETCGTPAMVPALTRTRTAVAETSAFSTTAAGGEYRLCWCASSGSAANSSCEVGSTFLMDAGALTLVGPSPHQTWTCISGMTCLLDDIKGHHLSLSDHYLILHTCGVQDVAARFPEEGSLVSITSPSCTPPSNSSSCHGIRATFGQVPVTAASGTYRLCWCQADANCGARSQFLVDVGSLQLFGIQDIQSRRTCVSGQSCFIQRLLDTSVPSASNWSFTPLLVLDTCGVSNLRGNESHQSINPQVAMEAGRAAGWQVEYFPSVGGLYRLCWCSQGCSRIDDFHTDVGELMLIGPYPLTQARGVSQLLNTISFLG